MPQQQSARANSDHTSLDSTQTESGTLSSGPQKKTTATNELLVNSKDSKARPSLNVKPSDNPASAIKDKNSASSARSESSNTPVTTVSRACSSTQHKTTWGQNSPVNMQGNDGAGSLGWSNINSLKNMASIPSSMAQETGDSKSISSGAQNGPQSGDPNSHFSNTNTSSWPDRSSGWGNNAISSNSVMSSSSLSISSSSDGSNKGAASLAGSQSVWGSSGNAGGGASGWGDPPKTSSSPGWGSPAASPNPNAGTEAWGQSKPAGMPGGGGWGGSNQSNNTNSSWGQSQQPARPPSATGWGQPGESKPAPGWGEPDKSNSIAAAGWPSQDTSSAAWGAPPSLDGNKPNTPSSWGAPGSAAASNSQWGSQPPTPNTNQPSTGWGTASSTSSQAPGGPVRPIGSQPESSQPASSSTAAQSQQSSTWAGIAGRGLDSNATTTKGSNASATVVGSTPGSQITTKEEYISKIVNANEGWGKTRVRQDTAWDAQESRPQMPPRNPPPQKPNGVKPEDANIWNQPNNGTAIWEATKEVNPPPQQPQPAPVLPAWASVSGGSNTQWTGNDADGGTWNGPPDNTNVWSGPPSSSQQQQQQQQAPPQQTPPQWAQQGPPANQWQGGGGGGNQWQGSNDNNQWGQKPPEPAAQWGGPPNPNQWPQKPDGPPPPHWGAPPPKPEPPAPQWENKPPEWNQPGPPDMNKPGGGDSQWGKKDDPIWDRNGTSHWGEPSSGPPPTQPPVGVQKPDMPPAWPEAGGHQSGRSSTSSWGDGSDSEQPTGWGDPHPDKSVDDGTSLWGDPSSGGPKPPVGWNGNGPKPGDKTAWNQPPPVGRPGPGWEQQPPTSDNAMWANQNPQMKSWGDGQWTGAKPKPGWGDAMDWSKNVINKNHPPQMRSKMLQQLMALGFKKEDAQHALINNNMNLENAMAELMATAGKRPDMDLGDQKGRPLQARMDDLSDANLDSPFAPNSMPNAPFANPQNPLASNPLKPGMPGAANPMLNPMLQQQQQKYLLQNKTAAAGIPPVPRGQTVQQQMLHQQQLVQQLNTAVQAGLISPHLLNQQLTSNVLIMLNQLLNLQRVLQRLVQQQQSISQNKSLNPIQRQTQLEQLNQYIQKIKLQIVNQQAHIQQTQLPNGASVVPGKSQPGSAPNQNPALDANTASRDMMNIKEGLKNLEIKDDHAGGNPPVSGGSRLSQWKLPTPDKGSNESLNKAVGSKPLGQSVSNPDLQGNLPFSDNTWSPSVSSVSSSAWPSTSTTTTTSTSSSANSPAESKTSESGKESPSSVQTTTVNSSGAETATSDSTNNAGGGNAVADSLDIAEFVPGQKWSGLKDIANDIHATPGSISRALSVSGVPDDYIVSTLGKAKSASASPNSNAESSISSAWSLGGEPLKSGGSWSGQQDAPGSMGSSLGWSPSAGGGQTRPPPGLYNRSVSWTPGESRSVGPRGGGGYSGKSNLLLIKNLTPQMDEHALKAICNAYGQLTTFNLMANYGQALVGYRSREEALKAYSTLKQFPYGNHVITAELVSDNDSNQLAQQQQAGPRGHQGGGGGGGASSFWGAPESSSLGYGSKGGLWGNSGYGGGNMPGGAGSLWAPLDDPMLPNNLLS